MQKKYTLAEMEDIFHKLEETYNKFKHLNKCEQTLYTADGKSITITIPLSSVPHLLGVDTNYYSSVFSPRQTSSCEIFEEMINRGAYNIYTNMDKFNIDNLISPYVLQKIENFFNIIWLNIENTELVCHYDKEKTYGYSLCDNNFDHLIVSKLENGKYSYVTLSDYENKGNKLYVVPRSNQLYDTREELNARLVDVLINQNITIPTFYRSFDSTKYEEKSKWNLNIPRKMEKTGNALEYAKKFDAVLDVSYDYNRILNLINRSNTVHKDNSYNLDLISEIMRNGNIITEKALGIRSFSELNDELVSIIDAYNNVIASKTSLDEKPIIDYSAMRKQNEELNAEILRLQSEKADLEGKISIIEGKYADADNQAKTYAEKIKQIKNIINTQD